MDSKDSVVDSTVLVTREKRFRGVTVGPIEEKEEKIAIHKFITEPAKVGVEMGATLSLGGYESIRVSIRMEVPCYVEELENTYLAVKDTVEKRVQEEIEGVRRFTEKRMPL